MRLLKYKLFATCLVLALCFGPAYAYAAPAVTIEGVTYTDYALVTSEASGASISVNYIYGKIEEALAAGANIIILDQGTHIVNDIVRVTKDGTQIIGKNKTNTRLQQTNPNKDLLQIYANDTVVTNLTLDTQTYNAYAAYVIWDGHEGNTEDVTLRGNRNLLQNCNVLGGNKSFTLYLAGPSYHTDVIYTRYRENLLNTGNRVLNNYMEGRARFDTFSISLQKNAEVRNNEFVGGEVDLYMSADTIFDTNSIRNSRKTGIYISGPINRMTITNNTIRNSAEHGMKSHHQIDNIPLPVGEGMIDSSTIENNTITDSGETGMDLNHIANSKVRNNTIIRSQVHGISLIRDCFTNEVSGNQISAFGLGRRDRGSGIFLTVGAKANNIHSNKLSGDASRNVYAGVFIETDDSFANDFQSNEIDGSFDEASVSTYGDDNVFGESNIIKNLQGTEKIWLIRP